jgi:uncharacterized membrane protein (UPF0127 family)
MDFNIPIPKPWSEPSIELTFDSGQQIKCFAAISTLEKLSGLASYPDLKDAEGLWFPYKKESFVMIWNRGVPYDIDVAYISKSDMKVNTIISLEADSTNIVIPTKASSYVVEARKGIFGELGIEVGSSLKEINNI